MEEININKKAKKPRQKVLDPLKLEEQEQYMDMVRTINQKWAKEHGRNPLVSSHTIGCQMNEHDSEELDYMFGRMGYDKTDNIREADFIIYNTCAVRENAETKVYGNLGQLRFSKRKNPDLKIALCGCMMQQPHVVEEIKKNHKHVNLMFGTHNLYRFPELLYKHLTTGKTITEVWDVDGEVIEGLHSNRKYDLKAFVNIMYGCNNFCTYCIVPYTRGRERSRKYEDIIEEIEDLVANGTKEVTLLGQNVNSYGKTLEDPISFAELLRKVNDIEGIERIRFMTPHPKDISDEVIYAMRDCEHVCEFLHLPMQCGSTELLKKMNRHYSKEDYLKIIEKARKEIPDVVFSTDIMIGFPGETLEDVQDTIDVVEAARYDSAFTFIYSKRNGTPAAKMENQIPEDEKHRRFEEVLSHVNRIAGEINEGYMGKTVEVLVEGRSAKNPNRYTGKTRGNKTVNFNSEEDLTGRLVMVHINDPKSFSLNGEVVEIVK